jgi:hypothetical protein
MIQTPEQEMMRHALRGFAQGHPAPFAAQSDHGQRFPRNESQELGMLSTMDMLVPLEWGGARLNHVSLVVALEKIAATDGGTTAAIVCAQTSLVCDFMLKYGNQAQNDDYLHRLASGEWSGGICLAEPHAGSDAAALCCSAVHDGKDWVINGAERFITSGKHAQLALVFAVTDPAAGRNGISCFLVPTAMPGCVVSRLGQNVEQHAGDTAAIMFDDCRVPADALLCREGTGYAIALASLEAGLICIAAQFVGMARAALDAAVNHAREYKTSGLPLREQRAVASRLADMAAQVDTARELTLHAAALRDAGRPCLKGASMAKLFACTMAERVCSDAIQIRHDYGCASGFPVELVHHDARATHVYMATSDTQRAVIVRAAACA